MSSHKIVIGTRGSPLAVAQSAWFGKELQNQNPSLQIQFKKITTSGDKIKDRFLNEVGGKGLFVKEIEEALLAKEIDMAVHSLKDVPAEIPDRLELACFPKREDFEDVLVTSTGVSLEHLPAGALIGTVSLRRKIQIEQLHPKVSFQMLRGNIDTRLTRLQAGEFNAIVLAKAGMKRLGLDLSHAVPIPIVPAPGQGTLGIEIRKGEDLLQNLLRPLHDLSTAVVSQAEREVMKQLGGGCNLPLGVFGQIQGDQLFLEAFIASLDGKKIIKEKVIGSSRQPIDTASLLLEVLWKQGAKGLIAS